MKRICAVSGKSFEITDADLKFYEKMGVPVPKLCPEERQRRRLAWRNERNLYQRECDCCKKKIISVYNQSVNTPIYCSDCWWKDSWNALESGKDFNFTENFFSQFQIINYEVPKINLVLVNTENSNFCNYTGDLKNCYLCFGSIFAEDCYYGSPYYCKDCVDILVSRDSELSYECIDCTGLYQSYFCQNSKNCSDSWFLKNCIGCDHCFGCINLRNKSYYFLNKPLSKKNWEKKINELNLSKHSRLSNMRDQFSTFSKKITQRFAELQQCENCTGDHLVQCKNTHQSFISRQAEDSSFLLQTIEVKDSYDVNHMEQAELVIDSFGAYRNYKVRFCNTVYESNNMDYCDFCCINSHDCFGCSGLKNSQYCILNKQYSKDEYFALRDKIIEHMKQTGEWGEFFPIELSPFAYNETVAQEYFPMTKDEVLKRGWKWKDESTDKSRFVPTGEIPDDITDVSDAICNEILSCETCGKNYKIQKAELKFYRKMNLPIPHKCPNCRHKERMKLRNPRKLWKRTCDKCGIGIQTTFAPKRPETVYCEKCYLNAVN
jgi:hypothetical protein